MCKINSVNKHNISYRYLSSQFFIKCNQSVVTEVRSYNYLAIILYLDMPFICSCCGKLYDEMPLFFNSLYPDHYFSIPAKERTQRVELTESLCIIDEYFFHKGQILIPIIDSKENLVFNVWTTISEKNFELRNQLWNDPERIKQPPYFGWLQTIVPTYDSTINIKTKAFENEPGLIPYIEVLEDNHPLANDQQNGISYETACNKVEHIIRKWHNK